jgi:hypothetical protein
MVTRRRTITPGSSFGQPDPGLPLGRSTAIVLYGELPSISKAIDWVPPLRALDSLGRVS